MITVGMTTIAAIQEALKLYYLPGLRYQLNDRASAFLTQLERDSESVVGKKIVMALRYGRVGGIGNRADDGDLPTPNARKTKQAEWETRNLFARFQITDKTIKAARSNVGAFANMLEQEIADCEVDAKQDLSRQAMGDGTGKLAVIHAASYAGGVMTLTLYDLAGNDTEFATNFLAEGMIVDIWDVSAGTVLANAQAKEITLVNESTKQVQYSGTDVSGTIQIDNDYLVVSGNQGLELTGVRGVFESATLYGLSRTTYPWLNATRINVNGEISEVDIQKAIDDADRKAGAQINFLLCSYGVRRAYQNLLTAQKQAVNTLELKGGWTALSYNGMPLVAEKYIMPGKLYCLDLRDWKLYQMSDYEWLDEDGAMLSRVTGKAAWEATLAKYCDIGCSRPRGQVELYGITEH
ncbi:MAG: phage major capsid protein [Firmicutes bacterium]|nr:phage major capsid protein [Bacillota bacterium]